MADMNVAPLKIVGVEGLFGSIIMLAAVLPVVQLLPGKEGRGLHEDSIDTWHVRPCPALPAGHCAGSAWLPAWPELRWALGTAQAQAAGGSAQAGTEADVLDKLGAAGLTMPAQQHCHRMWPAYAQLRTHTGCRV